MEKELYRGSTEKRAKKKEQKEKKMIIWRKQRRERRGNEELQVGKEGEIIRICSRC